MSGNRSRYSTVPSHRLSRLAGFGMLGANIAARAAFEGIRHLSKGQLPTPADILVTPPNILKVTDELARMRGAALKIGQLLSMDASELMPRELAELMTRLRADADFMPTEQLEKVLQREWGIDWKTRFKTFDMRPIAAASIGQVHRATTADGRELAIKVQYPGIADSIDSDIENVISLFRLTGLAPAQEKLEPLMAEAKKQLHNEADYIKEAGHIRGFAEKLSGYKNFTLPLPQNDLSTSKVLAMSFVPGQSIDTIEKEPQHTRNQIFERLIYLALDEFFVFAFTQTDTNFANYSYDAETDRIGLLDFGAMRGFSQETIERCRQLVSAGLDGNRKRLKELTEQLKLYGADTPHHHRNIVDRIIVTIFAAVRQNKHYDFANEYLMEQLHSTATELAMDKTFNEIPPADIVFLQRKAIGLYLLGRRLQATIPLRDMLKEYVID